MSELPTPLEISDSLYNNGFSIDQANEIASEIYQPLKDEIDELKELINKLIEPPQDK
jgi:hypothetical protein